MVTAALFLVLKLSTPQALDLLFAVLSLAIFSLYHAWYYSWHLTDRRALGCPAALQGAPPHQHRVDRTGQAARQLFTQAVLTSGTDADFNLAVQIMRNPITAASILGTGASVGVTTLINVMLDADKMEAVRQMGRRDPLTGGSSIIEPEAKLGAAVAALFLSFFALAQALRLFVHYPFLLRAVHFYRSMNPDLAPAGLASENSATFLEVEAVKTCLRGQTFFSLGLRFLYLFIPLVCWTLGGTWLLSTTLVIVSFLYVLDQV